MIRIVFVSMHDDILRSQLVLEISVSLVLLSVSFMSFPFDVCAGDRC
jgi:hypothetical protein